MEFKPQKLGKYLLLERIAAGGMAEVYRAKSRGAGGFEKELAVKRILPTYSSNEDFRRMFEYEAKLSSHLTHANIVQIYDFVQAGEIFLLAMEYVDGKNLRQLVNKVKKSNFILPIELSAYVINEVCKGLEYAHSKKDSTTGKSLNIIHRDMSPQNIMISYDGAVKIVDFGIAKAKDRVDETRSGVIKGKFGYMSPEQANGLNVDARSDVFSTGIILYELLTGKRLFATDNDLATLKLIQECVIPQPTRINPKIPVELERILLKALTKDLKLRYQTAGQFQRQLQEFLGKNFSHLTQGELSAVMRKVFQQEISQEKKGYEQKNRQSIPFSQQDGVKPTPDEFEGIEEALEGEMTKSEYEVDTAVTNGEESGQEEVPVREEKNSTVPATRVAGQKTEVSDASVDSTVAKSQSIEKTEVDNQSLSLESSVSNTNPKASTDSKVFMNQISESSANEKSETDGDTASEHMPVLDGQTVVTGSQDLFFEEDKTGESNQTESPVGKQIRAPKERSISMMNSMSRKEPQLKSYTATNAPNTSSSNTSSSFMMEEAPSDVSNSNGFELERIRTRRRSQHTSHRPEYSPKKRSSVIPLLLLLSGAGLTAALYRVLFDSRKIIPTVAQIIEPRDVTNAPKQIPPADEFARGAPKGECAVRIESDPTGATVSINSQQRGPTPLTISVPCKKDINLEIEKPGYDSVSENVFIKDRESKILRSLRQIPMGGLILVLTRNAEVYLDGTIVGEALANQPFEVRMKAGVRHRLRLKNGLLGVDIAEDVTVEKDFSTKRMIRIEEGDKRKPTSR